MNKFFYKTLVLCAVFLLLYFTRLNAQTFNGDMLISSQADIDNFNYTNVYGDITIQETTPGDITNLNGLSELITAYGIIITGNSSLASISGLTNLQHTGTFEIKQNPSLIEITGLKSLTSLSVLYIYDNNNLTNINGFLNLNSGYYLTITDNDDLTNINGLSNLRFSAEIKITGNSSLTEFCGLYSFLYFGNIDMFGTMPYTIDLSNNARNITIEEIIEEGPCGEVEKKSYIAVFEDVDLAPGLNEASGGAMFVLNEARDSLEYWIRLCNLHCDINLAVFDYTGYELLEPITDTFVRDSNGYFAHGYWTSTDSKPLSPEQVAHLFDELMVVDIFAVNHYLRANILFKYPVSLYANLEGSQEVPPVNTMGSGEGLFTLSGDGDSLYYNVTSYNLSGPISAAHFHAAPPGETGPVIKPISFTGDSLSEGWWTNSDNVPLTPELVSYLLGCYQYVNVHTSNYPNGEIRGQIYKTENNPMDYMTVWAARNDANPDNFSKLSFYSLAEEKPFENDEGDITGYDGQKNIVDMTFDIKGNLYFLNNTWTSMIYRIKPSQVDLDPSTSVYAKQMGRTRLFPDETYVWLTSIQFINSKLYGYDNRTNKLYDVNPYNAYVKEIAVIDAAESKAAGFALRADGNVYLLKNIDEKRSEIWKFNSFPSADLTLVTEVPSLGKLRTLSSHPNGNLYATCTENLYEINLTNKTIGVLKDHKITASAMDFDYFTEKQTESSGTIPFTNLDGVTAVGDFTEGPKSYELSQNYPNPFNPVTTIKYALPEASFVKLVVYNSLGEVVRTLVNDNRGAGYYETVFDAKDLSSGMYIYRLEAGQFISTAKMILIK